MTRPVAAAARFALTLGLSLALLLVPSFARAGEAGDGMPIVASGREADIQALAAPNALSKEISPGWTFADIAISATAIRFIARGPGAATATLRLEYPERAPSPERTASFALHRETSAGGAGEAPPQTILDPLALAVLTNDKGHFWPAAKPVDLAQGKPGDTASSVGSRRGEVTETRWVLTLRRKLLIGGLAASLLLLFADRLRKKPAAS